MKILFLTQWFDPEPAFKGLIFARALVARGHQVEVLTGFPNYPGGKVYPGYRVRFKQRESMDGVGVTRVPLYPSHDMSAVRRAANYASFAISAATIGVWSVPRADVAYVYHPPATIAFPAMVLKATRGVPFVLNIMDLWPDTVGATGMLTSPAVLGAVGSFCNMAYRAAARVAVVTPGFKRAIVSRGIPEDKVEVVYNWGDEAALTRPQPDAPILKEAGIDGRFTVVFAGTMGRAQALSSVLKAAELVAAREPRVLLVFVGGGVEAAALKAEAESRRLANVRFLPVRPAAEVGPLMAAADVLLVHLRRDPLFEITIPSKTQAYMAAGRPVLMAVKGDASDLVREAGAGLCVSPEDPEAMAEAICRMSRLPPEALAEMGAHGRDFYVKHLSLAAGTDRFEAMFREAARTA